MGSVMVVKCWLGVQSLFTAFIFANESRQPGWRVVFQGHGGEPQQHCRPRLMDPRLSKAETTISSQTDPQNSRCQQLPLRRHLSASDGPNFHANLSNLV